MTTEAEARKAETDAKKAEAKTVALARVETSSRGLVLNNLEDMRTVSQIILQSKLAPESYKTAEQIFVGLQTGAEIGLKPMQSLNSIAVIKGKPTLWGDIALALVKKSGLNEYCNEYFELDGKKVIEKDIQYTDIEDYPDGLVAVCETKRKSDPEPVLRYFSVADAKLAHLWKKPGSWTTHPKRMLKYKARAFNLRDTYPDVLYGMHLTEEFIGEEPLPAPQSDVPSRDVRRLPAPGVAADERKKVEPIAGSLGGMADVEPIAGSLDGTKVPLQDTEAGPAEPVAEQPVEQVVEAITEIGATAARVEKPCEICGGSGIAKEQHDGGEAELFCDCPTGKQKLEAFLKKHPDCRPLEPKAEPAAAGEPSIEEKGDVAALYVEVNGMYIAQGGTDFTEFAAYVLCVDESEEVDSPSKFTEEQLNQIKAYIETNGVAIS